VSIRRQRTETGGRPEFIGPNLSARIYRPEFIGPNLSARIYRPEFIGSGEGASDAETVAILAA
jgi:hypothetical protein